MRELPRKVTLILLFAVLGVCLYRARTQSFTVDEAHVYVAFVEYPLAHMAKFYDAANHVLHTLLMKASRSLLGNGEFALRVPSLMGAALYLAAVYRLITLVFRGWTQLVAATALVLHPLVLDLLVAARGYGLALGCLTWSLYYAIVWTTQGFDKRCLWRSGVFSGLSIGANLTFVFPAAALGAVLLTLAARDGRAGVWSAIDRYAGPAITTAFLILVLPLVTLTGDEFYFGTDSLLTTTFSLVETIGKVPHAASWRLVDRLAPALAYALLPLVALAVAVGAGFVICRHVTRERPDYRSGPFSIAGGTLAFTVLGLFAAHHLVGVRYPLARSGVFLIPLFTLAVLSASRLSGAVPRRIAVAFFGILSLVYLNQTDHRYFGYWRFDAGTARLLRRMQDDFAGRQAGRQATLAISPVLGTTVSYYRIRRRMDWLANPVAEKPESASSDYFILTERDKPLIVQRKLTLIDEDRISGSALARREP